MRNSPSAMQIRGTNFIGTNISIIKYAHGRARSAIHLANSNVITNILADLADMATKVMSGWYVDLVLNNLRKDICGFGKHELAFLMETKGAVFRA